MFPLLLFAITCGAAIPPADADRPMVIAGEGTWRLAIVRAGATTISCDGLTTADIKITSPRSTHRPDVRLAIIDSDARRWEVPAGDLRSFTIALPSGTYRVEAVSPHFLRATGTLTATGKPVQVALELKPLPVIRGTVLIRSSNEPMAGALVMTDTDDGGGTLTDMAGRFALEADPERWPEKVIVRAIPFAETTATVPAARADAQLEPIRLSSGRTVTVELEQTEPGQVRTLELKKIERGKYAGATVATLDVPSEEKTATLVFEDIEPGPYVVLAKGEEPWQQRGDRIDVEADLTVQQLIEPFRLTLTTRFDGEPLGRADLLLRNPGSFWEGTLKADEEGEANLELWQGGSYFVAVTSTAMSAPYMDRRAITAGVDHTWTIDIPGHAITGVVVDARSGKPVPGAAVNLKVDTAAEGMLAFSATANERGEFRLAPVRHGRHVLAAGARNYAPSETTYWFREPEQSRAVTIRLDSASSVRVRLLDHRGAPAGGVRAIQFRGGIRMEGVSDAAGILDVPVPDDAPADLYLIPRDGSFAHHRLTADIPETTVRIAEGASRIVLRARSERDEPLAGVTLAVRYNGLALPPDILDAVAVLQGRLPRSNAQGEIVLERMPAGVYEFWPFSLAGEAPARLVVVPGENIAVMRFERVNESP